MEFNFNIERAAGNSLGNGIILIDGSAPGKFKQKDFDNICKLLDTVGERSSTAQELKTTITTGMKFFGTDQRIYMKCEANKFIGFIKVGKKKLFIYDELGRIHEMSPLCVLDFYTFEGCQRKGYGKQIYTAMINCEGIEPRKLAYDKPSFKFLNFLKKHFNLYDFIPQNNNFVVFNDYYLPDKPMYQHYGNKNF